MEFSVHPFMKRNLHEGGCVMENQIKAWIHCRVSKESLRYLLRYQEERLKAYCDGENYKIVGVSKEVSLGKYPTEYYLSVIITMVRRKGIDFVVIYDWTRLLIFKDLYMEFKLFCEMHGVEIIEIQEP